jgi:predicted membrane-bound mannosyltransferase
MVLPFGVGLIGAIIGMLVFGWPLTWWLKRSRLESNRAYVSAGLIGGCLSTLLISLVSFGMFFLEATLIFTAFGAFTGGATGHFWWRYARKHEVEAGTETLIEVFE